MNCVEHERPRRALELLSRKGVERETGGGITARWLELAAHKGEGPPYIKISGRHVRYRREDVEAWLASRRITPEAGCLMQGEKTARRASTKRDSETPPTAKK